MFRAVSETFKERFKESRKSTPYGLQEVKHVKMFTGRHVLPDGRRKEREVTDGQPE